MKMSIDLYISASSPPCRTVMLVAAALGLRDRITVHRLNIAAGEHLSHEFAKLNPQHSLPTIVDDGFSLWESRAICRYLVSKYGGPNSSLYPTDLKARALVDQRLDFDLGTLYAHFASYFFPQFYGVKAEERILQKVLDALGHLNTFLEGQTFVAGTNLTIADLSLVVTVSTIEAANIELEEYPNIVRWYETMKTTVPVPDYQKANAEPLELFKALTRPRK